MLVFVVYYEKWVLPGRSLKRPKNRTLTPTGPQKERQESAQDALDGNAKSVVKRSLFYQSALKQYAKSMPKRIRGWPQNEKKMVQKMVEGDRKMDKKMILFEGFGGVSPRAGDGRALIMGPPK